ncbi:hypothetical protein PT974_09321 [Cladobotryum mycophilum]|uniref:Calcineurin-like phosphoesterase domain-containing protein n=1 Tax=Cladobotryum mycophilum TaxID=491253 RepID=A0ABR0SFZ1_9HYPO
MSASSTTPPETIKTRFLILSDTHGLQPQPQAASTTTPSAASTDDELSTKIGLHRAPTGYREPLAQADVALHCGDLTKRSGVEEFRRTFSMLRAIRAPLKLVICGNHDSAMDPDFYIDDIGGGSPRSTRSSKSSGTPRPTASSTSSRGPTPSPSPTAQRCASTQASTPPLRLLGIPVLPRRPQLLHPPGRGHRHDTRSPLGVLDTTRTQENAGCATLFRAITSSRPKIHCFGHIHEAWGAYLAKWQTERTPSSFIPFMHSSTTSIDTASSRTIQSLNDVKPNIGNEEMEESERKQKRLLELAKKRGFHVDLTEGKNQLTPGEQTLFVNAAVMDVRYYPTQLPWLIDVNLSKAG